MNNEIPVRRRRGGIPWWAWLIGLLLLGALAFALLNNMGGSNRGVGAGSSAGTAAETDDATGGVAGVAASGDAATSGGAGASAGADADGSAGGGAGNGVISDLAEVSDATDATTVAGREVAIDGATVLAVTGDVTFWVGESEEDRVFVRMDEDASGGEQGIEVEEGQTLRLTGQVEEVPSDTAPWELEDEEASAVGEELVYIAASKVEVVQ